MLRIERTNGPYISIRASGWVRARDYARFESRFSEEIGRWHRPVPLLLDMRGFRGWTPGGLVRDIIWDVRNRSTFSKIAVIGDAIWHRWITAAGAPLFHARLKFFDAAEEHSALTWLGIRHTARSSSSLKRTASRRT